eukprot:CAMPEP_0203762282 /NCGR_PEP_ID=MMETSP0098-20131031/15207_1 /ASSEMBLY_ACC=CAM_ASM_000208 /TAXON_ID=96639 /ORGANISM=" , Strain NY0313808BC1" /LENGTH=451 /DNA_ID=CAMNT_0050656637 /DNA_START=195 /DNA_END=1550 /DNA_ORIENTATION=-
MGKRQRTDEDLDECKREFVSWLESKGVKWSKDKVSITNDEAIVIHGFGVVCRQDIEEGDELFRIPRTACFGACTGEDKNEDAEEVDSQKDIAMALLKEIKLGYESQWAPFVATLPHYETYSDLPWLWEDWEDKTKGTELYEACKSKRERLKQEQKEIDADTYRRLCGVVISHLNPFFGRSIVPFVYMLNCPNDNKPNVEFYVNDELDPDMVVGYALRGIKKGEELTQSYGTSSLALADLIYRCGFVMNEDVPLNDVVSIPATSLAAEERLPLLDKAGVVQACPWDGLEDKLTVELSREGDGLVELGVLCFAGGLTHSDWVDIQEFCEASFESEGLDEMDTSAIVLCCALEAKSNSSWPPVDRDSRCKELASKLEAGRAGAHEEEDDDEDDEELWGVLCPKLSLQASVLKRCVSLLERKEELLGLKQGDSKMMQQLKSVELGIVKKAKLKLA